MENVRPRLNLPFCHGVQKLGVLNQKIAWDLSLPISNKTKQKQKQKQQTNNSKKKSAGSIA